MFTPFFGVKFAGIIIPNLKSLRYEYQRLIIEWNQLFTADERVCYRYCRY